MERERKEIILQKKEVVHLKKDGTFERVTLLEESMWTFRKGLIIGSAMTAIFVKLFLLMPIGR